MNSAFTKLDLYERVVKFTLGCALAICEAAFWGARPATFTFIGTVLFGSELLRLVRPQTKRNGDES